MATDRAERERLMSEGVLEALPKRQGNPVAVLAWRRF